MTDLSLLRGLQRWFAGLPGGVPPGGFDAWAICLSEAIKEIENSRATFVAITQDADVCLDLLKKLRLENLGDGKEGRA